MIELLLNLMSIDSTTGREADLADYLVEKVPLGAKVQLQSLANGQKNVFFSWGVPKIIFCTHLDTVPPYLPPSMKNGQLIYGRGACDAKGQIAVLYSVCQKLCQERQSNFGLLLTAGEETDSAGAKLANQQITTAKFTIIGEPTDCKLVTAAKGGIAAKLEIRGKAAHSGYPEQGISAIEGFRKLLNQLTAINFPTDPQLGKTYFNLGRLNAGNAVNVIPDYLECQLLFRTTFASHQLVKNQLEQLANEQIRIELLQDSVPMSFMVLPGFAQETVSFGSDATSLNRLGSCLMYGPGSILHAHTLEEHVRVADLEKAVEDLKNIYYQLVELL